MTTLEAVVESAVGEEHVSKVLFALRDSFQIHDVTELQAIVKDDAMIVAVTNRSQDISVVHWAKLRKFCKSNTLHVPSTAELSLETTKFKYLPVLNIVHDYFDSAPSVPGVQLIMNIVVLVDALMLGIALGLPSALGGYDSALGLIARFNGEGTGNDLYNKWCVDKYGKYGENGWDDDKCGWALMTNFTYQATMAGSLIGASLLCMVALYTFFSVSSFTGPDEATSKAMMRMWWRPVQLAIGTIIFMTGTGIMFMFGAVKMVATFNFPDYFLDYHGLYEYSDKQNDPRQTVNYYNNMSWGWPVAAFLMGIATASIGLARKSHALKMACQHINSGGELSKSANNFNDMVHKQNQDDIEIREGSGL